MNAMADPFPFYFPAEARRLFQTESLLRRFSLAGRWMEEAHLLEIFGSVAGVALKKYLKCALSVVEPDARVIDFLKERAKAAGALEKLAFKYAAPTALDYPKESFDGIFSLGRVIDGPLQLARQWRPLLADQGRIGMTTLVQVTKSSSDAVVEYWKKRLAGNLLTPMALLKGIEASGFEPEFIDTVGGTDLDEYYREIEASLGKVDPKSDGPATLNEEMQMHRAQGGRLLVSYAFVVARRKEPGEQPPVSRDGH
jgi:hypothetical protein